jgi:hypothetical protein
MLSCFLAGAIAANQYNTNKIKVLGYILEETKDKKFWEELIAYFP